MVLRRQDGITLVEVLIGLSLLGVVGTIYLPRFLAERTRALQTEVKAELAAFKIAQSTVFTDYGIYTDNLGEIAWKPMGRPRYLYGFVSDESPDASGINDTSEFAAYAPHSFPTINMVVAPGIPLTYTDLPPDTYASEKAYRVGAVANLDGDLRLDVWTMGKDGAPVHVVNDMTAD